MNDSEKLQAIRAILDAPESASAPAQATPSSVTQLARGEEDRQTFAAGQARAYAFHHAGGIMELLVSAVPGSGTFNRLTESLVGPRSFDRVSTPAGTLKRHDAVKEDMPPGMYQYTVAPDMSCALAVQKVQ